MMMTIARVCRVRRLVAGRLVNVHSKNDWILAMVHRGANMNAKGVAGLGPIDSDAVENVDVSVIVGGHLNYRKKLKSVLRYLNIHSSIDTASWDYSTLTPELKAMMAQVLADQKAARRARIGSHLAPIPNKLRDELYGIKRDDDNDDDDVSTNAAPAHEGDGDAAAAQACEPVVYHKPPPPIPGAPVAAEAHDQPPAPLTAQDDPHHHHHQEAPQQPEAVVYHKPAPQVPPAAPHKQPPPKPALPVPASGAAPPKPLPTVPPQQHRAAPPPPR